SAVLRAACGAASRPSSCAHPLTAEPLTELFRVRRFGEAEHHVVDVIAAEANGARPDRKRIGKPMHLIITLAHDLIGRDGHVVRPLALHTAQADRAFAMHASKYRLPVRNKQRRGVTTATLIAQHYLTPAAKKQISAMLAADNDPLSARGSSSFSRA